MVQQGLSEGLKDVESPAQGAVTSLQEEPSAGRVWVVWSITALANAEQQVLMVSISESSPQTGYLPRGFVSTPKDLLKMVGPIFATKHIQFMPLL